MRTLTGPVVVGYHPDAGGEDAVSLALLLGDALQLPVLVARVYPGAAPIGIGRVDAEWTADRQAAAAEVLRAAQAGIELQLSERPVQAHRPGIRYRLLPSSSAAHGLSDLAAEVGAAAVVVGSAATEGQDRGVFAGSTASRLLSGAEHPVAVAPQGFARRPGPRPGALGCVGAAFVPTPEGHEALTVAGLLAHRAGAGVLAVTAVRDDDDAPTWPGGRDAGRALTATTQAAFTSALAAAAAAVEPPADTRLLVGDVVTELADLEMVDLLVCGSRGYGPVRRVLLGGVASRLARRARMPLLVVPRPA